MTQFLRFIFDSICGAAIHLLLMLACSFVVMLFGGGKPPAVYVLIFGVFLPFFASGVLIVKHRLKLPLLISPFSVFFSLFVVAAATAWYWDWDWTHSTEIWFATPGVLFSLAGVITMRSIQKKSHSIPQPTVDKTKSDSQSTLTSRDNKRIDRSRHRCI